MDWPLGSQQSIDADTDDDDDDNSGSSFMFGGILDGVVVDGTINCMS